LVKLFFDIEEKLHFAPALSKASRIPPIPANKSINLRQGIFASLDKNIISTLYNCHQTYKDQKES
jgi:hypothetical protein